MILAEDLYDAAHAHCEKLVPYKCEGAGPEFRINGIDLRKEKYMQPGRYMPIYQRADGSQTFDQDDTRTVPDCIWPVRPTTTAEEYLNRALAETLRTHTKIPNNLLTEKETK